MSRDENVADKRNDLTIDRRSFLKSAAVTGLSTGLFSPMAHSSQSESESEGNSPPRAPSEVERIREQELPDGYTAEEVDRYFVSDPGSDYMVDVMRSLNIEYFAINPGDTFRGLHESVVNYGGNRKPELITCLHEEQAGALAHGYAKVAGKPLAVGGHGTVGIQHMTMAVYNAWADRVPIVVIGGNHLDIDVRPNYAGWAHTAQDPVRVIRDFIKWDDQPVSLRHFGESFVRAYQLAMTPPMAPVAIVAEVRIQEEGMKSRPAVPAYSPVKPPQAPRETLREVAQRLIGAESPVIIADRYARSQEGVDLLVELAELLQLPIVDRGARMNFPTNHHLNHTFRESILISQADVVLGLELIDAWGVVNHLRKGEVVRHAPENLYLVDLSSDHLFIKSNYQDFQRYYPAAMAIGADAQASLPALIEEVKQGLSNSRRRVLAERGERHRRDYKAMREQLADEARYGWSASPVSTARICMEIWDLVKDKDWALTSPTYYVSRWPNKLWDMDKHYQYIGYSGGLGVGYCAPASVGAALAHREHGRMPVNLQSDGDLMYAPGSLWTAAHHNIPLLSIVHNNRGYHQEFMEFQLMALQRQRGVTEKDWRVGNEIDHPLIDYSELAKSMGVWAAGRVERPADLRPALQKAIEVVEAGEPALVDVLSQPR